MKALASRGEIGAVTSLIPQLSEAHRIHEPGPLIPPNSSSSSRSSFSAGATACAKVSASASLAD